MPPILMAQFEIISIELLLDVTENRLNIQVCWLDTHTDTDLIPMRFTIMAFMLDREIIPRHAYVYKILSAETQADTNYTISGLTR